MDENQFGLFDCRLAVVDVDEQGDQDMVAVANNIYHRLWWMQDNQEAFVLR